MSSAEKRARQEKANSKMDKEVVTDWVQQFGEDLKESAAIESSSKKEGKQEYDSTGSVFSFGDFDRMQEELEFKGNFYEKVKRKSLMLRESLEGSRL